MVLGILLSMKKEMAHAAKTVLSDMDLLLECMCLMGVCMVSIAMYGLQRNLTIDVFPVYRLC